MLKKPKYAGALLLLVPVLNAPESLLCYAIHLLANVRFI